MAEHVGNEHREAAANKDAQGRAHSIATADDRTNNPGNREGYERYDDNCPMARRSPKYSSSNDRQGCANRKGSRRT